MRTFSHSKIIYTLKTFHGLFFFNTLNIQYHYLILLSLRQFCRQDQKRAKTLACSSCLQIFMSSLMVVAVSTIIFCKTKHKLFVREHINSSFVSQIEFHPSKVSHEMFDSQLPFFIREQVLSGLVL